MKKFVAIALAFFAYNPAFAGDLGKGQGQGQGQQWQAHDQGQREIAAHRGCREGSEEVFLESTDSSGEGMYPVRYLCQNGRFVKVFKDARDYGPRERHFYGCREGSEETFLESTGSSGEGMYPVRYVCRGGRFVKVFKDARDYGPRERHYLGCREGSEETFLEPTDSSGEGSRPVRYVCRGGRFHARN